MKKALAILTALLLLTGCASHGEVDEMSFVRVVGIDKAGEKTVVTVATVKEETPCLTAEGDSFSDCLAALRALSDRTLFFGHTDVILFGEAAARAGTLPYLDAFVRSDEFRFDLPVIVVQGEARQLIVDGGDGEKTSTRLKTLLKNAPQMARASEISLSRVIEMLEEPFLGVYLPYVTSENEIVTVGGFCLLTDDRLSCFLPEEASRGLCLLTELAEADNLTVPDEGGAISLKLTDFSVETAVRTGAFTLNLSCLAEITGAAREELSEEDLCGILTWTEEKLQKDAESAVSALQNAGCDALNLGGVWERKAPREAEKMKNDWPEKFQQIPVGVTVTVSLNGRRSIGRPLKKRESDI